jgi:heme/copper-type cytochrome/quinol oxidase subunit 2
VAFVPLPAAAGQHPASRLVRIQASQYAYAPAEVHVNPGDEVTIELTSVDAVHGLYIDGYGVSVQADPGQTASLTFIADRSGTFRFRCSVTCGALHPFIIGKLTVGADTLLYRSIGLGLLAALGVMLSTRRLPQAGMAI